MDSSSSPWIATSLLAVALSVLLYRLINRHFFIPASITRQLRSQGISVLPHRPFIGHAFELRQLQQLAKRSDLDSPSNHNLLPHIHPFYAKNLSESAPGRTFVFWWGRQPRLVVTNPEDVKNIMTRDVKNFSKSKTLFKAFHRLFGSGILLADGDDWQNQRKILRPAFFFEKLQGMVADMHTNALEMTNAWAEAIQQSGGQKAEVEVSHDLKSVTADILARTCFGSSYKTGKSVFEKQELVLEIIIRNALAHSLIPGYRYLPTPSNLKCRKIERSIDRELGNIIDSRMSLIEGGAQAGQVANDLLGIILADEETDKKHGNVMRLSAKQIIAECKTFFFAGHETTANLLAWTMMLLSVYPEWQERVRSEVVEVCGSNAEAKIHPDQLNKLKLSGMVLNESLRLYPPVPELAPRVSDVKEDKFKLGDVTFPLDMGFAIPTLFIHRDKEQWGEDADEFRPERFRDGVSKACKHPYAFLPFGVGPRICIGQSFALLEAKVILAAVVQRFKFRLSPTYRHAPESAITMRPKHGMQIILECL